MRSRSDCRVLTGRLPGRSGTRPTRRSVPGRSLVGAWLLLLIVGPATPAAAQEDLAARAAADVVLVRENEVVDEDLYAGGNTITIEGTIEGDLIVWAFDRLDVSGTVEGDVIGFASSASISGSVEGSIRLVGFNVEMTGAAARDLFAIAWDVAASGTIGRDVLAWASTLTLNGEVERDMEGQTLNRTRVDGSVGRDMQMTVGALEIGAGASIGQDVIYQSRREASIDSEASIGGTVTRRAITVPNVRISAARFVGLLLAVLAFVWIGMLMIWLMPGTIREASEAVVHRWARSLVVGFAALFLPLFLTAAIIALAMLSPPDLTVSIVAIGAPVCLGLLLLLFLGLILAPVPIAIAVGRRILGRRRSAFAGYLFGIVLYLALLFIPYIGIPAAALVTILGLGALARGAVRARGSLRWTTGQPIADQPTGAVADGPGGEDVLLGTEDGDGALFPRLVVDDRNDQDPSTETGSDPDAESDDDAGPPGSDPADEERPAERNHRASADHRRRRPPD